METKPILLAVIAHGDCYLVLITNAKKPIAFYFNTQTGIQPFGQKGESLYSENYFERKCELLKKNAYPLTPYGGKPYEFAMKIAERLIKNKKLTLIKQTESTPSQAIIKFEERNRKAIAKKQIPIRNISRNENRDTFSGETVLEAAFKKAGYSV